MSDTTPIEGTGGAQSGSSQRAAAQLRIPKPGKLLRGRDIGPAFNLLNALARLKVTRDIATADDSGNYNYDAKTVISDLNAIISLYDPPIGLSSGTPTGTANIVAMQVVSYTTTNEYLSAKLGSFISDSVFSATGSAINVALPWELQPAQKPSGFNLNIPYSTNDIILCAQSPTGGTGVYVSGTQLIYQDLNVGGRCWLAPQFLYLGDWASGTAYVSGNVVRLRDGSVNAGVYVCSTANTGNQPTFPEPFTPYWELIALGVQSTSVCVGGSKTAYVNSTPPF